MIQKIINRVKALWGKSKTKHTKKQSKVSMDIVIGPLRKVKVSNLIVGIKVVTHEGIANVKKLRENDWVVVSYATGRVAEHKLHKLFQYFVEIKDRRNHTVQMYPLSYSDYEFIHPKDVDNSWMEGFITKKGYFKLLDEVKEEREHMPVFNKSHGGRNVLEALEKKGCSLYFKNGKLLIKQ